MYSFTNQFILHIKDSAWNYNGGQGVDDGPFEIKLKMQAVDKVPNGLPNTGEFRMAYARP